jgi:putative PIN family toxin of toxin-antitoxin system
LILAVIDTNVLMSALLSSEGPPGIVLGLAFRGLIVPVFNRAILLEYERVLRRPRFSFEEAEIAATLRKIEDFGRETQDGFWPEPLPDSDDGKFLVAAAATEANLITGSLRDFPAPARRHVRVMTPRQFVDTFANEILNFPKPST